MVDGAGTEVVLISSSPEVLAHHSPPDTTRKDESLSFPFDSLSLCSPILPTLYTLEYSFSGIPILLISFFPSFFFLPPIASTRFRESLFSSPDRWAIWGIFLSLSLSLSRDKGGKKQTSLVHENPVARIPILSIETCHVSCVEVWC